MLGLTYNEAMENSSVVLTLTLNNTQPIALSSFVKAFTSLASEYQSTLRSNPDFEHADAEIYIKQIRSGSIIADMIPWAAATAPLVLSEADKVFVAVEFVEKWKDRLTKLKNGIVPDGSTKTEMNRWIDAVENVARDPDATSTLEAATFEDNRREVRASFKFNSSEARRITKTIEGEFERLEVQETTVKSRVLLVFTRSDISDAPIGQRSGERVLIEEISTKPLAITYGSELAEQRIKHEIRESDENIYKKGFNVDVRIQTKGGKPVAYCIVHVHDVIELPE